MHQRVQRVDRTDHVLHGVAPEGERRGAGMRGFAAQFHHEPAAALDAGDDADVAPLGVQPRPLLDMRFHTGVRRRRPAPDHPERPARQVALGGQLLAERRCEAHAGRVFHRVPGVRGRTRQPRSGEATAFLVGPGHDLDRSPQRPRAVAGRLAHRLHRLQRRDHAVDAVEAPAIGLGVHVAAGEHRRGDRVGAFLPEEQVAERVHRRLQAERRCPGDQPPPRLAVERGEGGAVDAPAALRASEGADLAHRHEPAPLPGHVDGGPWLAHGGSWECGAPLVGGGAEPAAFVNDGS